MTSSPNRQLPLTFETNAEQVIADLSAVRCVDNFLWLGCDEGQQLERLTLTPEGAKEHKTFAIADYLPLPNNDEEVDVEGLAYGNYYLWVLGSHSIKRKKPDPEATPEANLKRMKTLEREDNRYLLGRIPLVDGQLYRECPHPHQPDILLTAAQIKRKKRGNQLSRILADDPHLGKYLKANIPGKENGFDLEGIAVSDDRVFIGLRGPVLRGWAILIELFLKESSKDILKLDKSRGRYRKYFLDLEGHGIRDLCFAGTDLLILAGPTMDLDGLAHVYHLKQALSNFNDHWLTPESSLDLLDKYHSEKAEGMTLMGHSTDNLLIVYDSPSSERQQANQVMADIFSVDFS